MNRRGSLEWSLETLGKLLIGALVLVVIGYLVLRIIGLFVGDYEDTAAHRTISLLGKRIEATAGQDLVAPESSIVFDYPAGGFVVAYSKGQDSLLSCSVSNAEIFRTPRPKECGSRSCLCILERGEREMCVPVEVDAILFVDARQSLGYGRCVLNPTVEQGHLIPIQSLKIEESGPGVILRYYEEISTDLIVANSGRQP